MVEDVVQKKTGQQTKAIEDMTLDELDEMEDEEDDRILLQYRSGIMAWHTVFMYIHVQEMYSTLAKLAIKEEQLWVE